MPRPELKPDPDLPNRIARTKRERDRMQLKLDSIMPWKWVTESDGRKRGLYTPEQRDQQKDIEWRISILDDLLRRWADEQRTSDPPED